MDLLKQQNKKKKKTKPNQRQSRIKQSNSAHGLEESKESKRADEEKAGETPAEKKVEKIDDKLTSLNDRLMQIDEMEKELNSIVENRIKDDLVKKLHS